jgi:hypothetical protein
MTDQTMPTGEGATRIAAIEALPLLERADAYLGMHDELAERLESRGSGV